MPSLSSVLVRWSGFKNRPTLLCRNYLTAQRDQPVLQWGDGNSCDSHMVILIASNLETAVIDSCYTRTWWTLVVLIDPNLETAVIDSFYTPTWWF